MSAALAEPPQERVVRMSRADPDPGIHGAGAVLGGDDRIEVKFGHLMQIVGETGDPQQHVPQRSEVGASLIDVLGSFTPELSAAIFGSFHVLMLPSKMPASVAADSLRVLTPLRL